MSGMARETGPELLPVVRRMEAAGFRAWPASVTLYDGAWLIRMTAGHPAKRLNSVNPLDPGDAGRLEKRVARIAQRFEAYDRPVTFRMSPLAGPALSTYLDSLGWERFDESLVMAVDLRKMQLDKAMDLLPVRDVARFTGAHGAIRGNAAYRAGLSEIIGGIEPETGLFLLESNGEAMTTVICVQDGDLAGLFEVATNTSNRRQGFARNCLLSALKWARMRGAGTGWLQVEADNHAAIALYESIGFAETYRYHYRRPPDETTP